MNIQEQTSCFQCKTSAYSRTYAEIRRLSLQNMEKEEYKNIGLELKEIMKKLTEINNKRPAMSNFIESAIGDIKTAIEFCIEMQNR